MYLQFVNLFVWESNTFFNANIFPYHFYGTKISAAFIGSKVLKRYFHAFLHDDNLQNAIYCSGEMKEVFGNDPLSYPIGRNREWLSTFLTIL